MQPVDFTTFTAVCVELRSTWLPARLEQVYQRDRFTVALALRTLEARGWLTLSWHPQAARLGMGEAPPRSPDTFTFSQQLWHQLGGLALVAIEGMFWERVADLQFAKRPGDPVLWHLYVEVMGQYSNVVLTNAAQQVITAAQQVNAQQSRLRTIQTGQPYEHPPMLTSAIPRLEEPFDRWRDQIRLIPGALKRNVIQTYRGLSSALVTSMLQTARLEPTVSTTDLQEADWHRLFDCWQFWLQALAHEQFQPGWTASGYTVLGWSMETAVESVQPMLHRYYTEQLNQQEFSQLRHHLQQTLHTVIQKLESKQAEFQHRWQLADRADRYREQADLLMAYSHEWQPGQTQITLLDFVTNEPVTIALNPEKNAVQNAQVFYKQHQKLKRSRRALEPLLADVQAELAYLAQVEVALMQVGQYSHPDDLVSLRDIRDELIQQGYLQDPTQRYRQPPSAAAEGDRSNPFWRYRTPNGFEVWIGRNNRQNDQLTFRLANDYDLWFHTQEIPGSHVLLRLEPGAVPEEADLQFTADLAAYYSRARQSDRVPVIYTEPRLVYKPKGAKPGMAIYKQETVIWGQPLRGQTYPIANSGPDRPLSPLLAQQA